MTVHHHAIVLPGVSLDSRWSGRAPGIYDIDLESVPDESAHRLDK